MEKNACNGSTLSNIYGIDVFGDAAMRERLPKATYQSLKNTIEQGLPLDPSIAEVVANAMKDWAIDKGATHYTHWFQPMTGVTAEKHDSFISPTPDGRVIMEFSGKELSKGESDASSFPSGGLRATFEARGYTVWDCTSPAFVKDGSLYIPTAFCSYTSEALDKKTPLLRSMEALNQQALRLLRLIGNTTSKRVISNMGPEQEYFLVHRDMYQKRKDLIFTGRTLFGANPPKGQEMEDHYYAKLQENVSSYMRELDFELWKLGISAKTKHNEVAPAQHELAPIFNSSNIAADHNQLTMEIMQSVAVRHDLVCLLHEKPFAGVNGSGKHNNWSLNTDDGLNLLSPGKDPRSNKQFLLFLCAVIKAVDDYADLLLLSIATPGNDLRLGGHEAPPAIFSVYLGETLTEILDEYETGVPAEKNKIEKMQTGVMTLPMFQKDTTDRNRTSPFAFTANKFEFRMVGSAASIACPNYMLNTIVADAVSYIADRLEAAEDREKEIDLIIRDIIREHKRIIYNGNNYSQEWIEESRTRGLASMSSTPDILPAFLDEKNVQLFEKYHVLSQAEIEARCEILLENYVKVLNIEALTMLDMSKQEILPACMKYIKFLADTILSVTAADASANLCMLRRLLNDLTEQTNQFELSIQKLDEARLAASQAGEYFQKAQAYRNLVFDAMEHLRAVGDKLETMMPKEFWPLPTYADMLYNV